METKSQYIYKDGRYIKLGKATKAEIEIVNTLPDNPVEGTIYLVEDDNPESYATSIKVDGETVPELEVGDGLEVVNGVLRANINVPKIITLPSKFFMAGEDVSVTDEEIALFVDNVIGIKTIYGAYYGVLLYENRDNIISIVFGLPPNSYFDSGDEYKIFIDKSIKTMSVEISQI